MTESNTNHSIQSNQYFETDFSSYMVLWQTFNDFNEINIYCDWSKLDTQRIEFSIKGCSLTSEMALDAIIAMFF